MKPKFQYFLNQHSNVHLEKDERQALRTRVTDLCVPVGERHNKDDVDNNADNGR